MDSLTKAEELLRRTEKVVEDLNKISQECSQYDVNVSELSPPVTENTLKFMVKDHKKLKDFLCFAANSSICVEKSINEAVTLNKNLAAKMEELDRVSKESERTHSIIQQMSKLTSKH